MLKAAGMAVFPGTTSSPDDPRGAMTSPTPGLSYASEDAGPHPDGSAFQEDSANERDQAAELATSAFICGGRGEAALRMVTHSPLANAAAPGAAFGSPVLAEQSSLPPHLCSGRDMPSRQVELPPSGHSAAASSLFINPAFNTGGAPVQESLGELSFVEGVIGAPLVKRRRTQTQTQPRSYHSPFPGSHQVVEYPQNVESQGWGYTSEPGSQKRSKRRKAGVFEADWVDRGSKKRRTLLTSQEARMKAPGRQSTRHGMGPGVGWRGHPFSTKSQGYRFVRRREEDGPEHSMLLNESFLFDRSANNGLPGPLGRLSPFASMRVEGEDYVGPLGDYDPLSDTPEPRSRPRSLHAVAGTPWSRASNNLSGDARYSRRESLLARGQQALRSWPQDGGAVAREGEGGPVPANRRRLCSSSAEDDWDTMLGWSEGPVASSTCQANLMIMSGGSIRREEGVTVELQPDPQPDGEDRAILAVTLPGQERFVHRPEHSDAAANTLVGTAAGNGAALWKPVGGGWSLEFGDGQEWQKFLDLHAECYRQNQRAAARRIPIPGVSVVGDYEARWHGPPFAPPPDAYLKTTETELDVAQAGTRVLYDMDDEDEAWLHLFNSAQGGESAGEPQALGDSDFERLVDALERGSAAAGSIVSLEDAVELCKGLEGHSRVAAVYEHWLRRRQKKGMALLRHFQPPAWEQYQNQLAAWQAETQALQHAPGVTRQQLSQQQKRKPPTFAFCLRFGRNKRFPRPRPPQPKNLRLKKSKKARKGQAGQAQKAGRHPGFSKRGKMPPNVGDPQAGLDLAGAFRAAAEGRLHFDGGSPLAPAQDAVSTDSGAAAKMDHGVGLGNEVAAFGEELSVGEQKGFGTLEGATWEGSQARARRRKGMWLGGKHKVTRAVRRRDIGLDGATDLVWRRAPRAVRPEWSWGGAGGERLQYHSEGGGRDSDASRGAGPGTDGRRFWRRAGTPEEPASGPDVHPGPLVADAAASSEMEVEPMPTWDGRSRRRSWTESRVHVPRRRRPFAMPLAGADQVEVMLEHTPTNLNKLALRRLPSFLREEEVPATQDAAARASAARERAQQLRAVANELYLRADRAMRRALVAVATADAMEAAERAEDDAAAAAPPVLLAATAAMEESKPAGLRPVTPSTVPMAGPAEQTGGGSSLPPVVAKEPDGGPWVAKPHLASRKRKRRRKKGSGFAKKAKGGAPPVIPTAALALAPAVVGGHVEVAVVAPSGAHDSGLPVSCDSAPLAPEATVDQPLAAVPAEEGPVIQPPEVPEERPAQPPEYIQAENAKVLPPSVGPAAAEGKELSMPAAVPESPGHAVLPAQALVEPAPLPDRREPPQPGAASDAAVPPPHDNVSDLGPSLEGAALREECLPNELALISAPGVYIGESDVEPPFWDGAATAPERGARVAEPPGEGPPAAGPGAPKVEGVRTRTRERMEREQVQLAKRKARQEQRERKQLKTRPPAGSGAQLRKSARLGVERAVAQEGQPHAATFLSSKAGEAVQKESQSAAQAPAPSKPSQASRGPDLLQPSASSRPGTDYLATVLDARDPEPGPPAAARAALGIVLALPARLAPARATDRLAVAELPERASARKSEGSAIRPVGDSRSPHAHLATSLRSYERRKKGAKASSLTVSPKPTRMSARRSL